MQHAYDGLVASKQDDAPQPQEKWCNAKYITIPDGSPACHTSIESPVGQLMTSKPFLIQSI
jgi:hypothetical protein